MFFWIDPVSGMKKTYDDFISDVNDIHCENALVNDANFYQGIAKLFKLMATSQRAYLLDPNQECEYELDALEDSQVRFKNVDELTALLKEKSASIVVKLTTSGTTGRAKIIDQDLEKLTRNVNLRFKNQVWGLCYHAYHMAGLQVIFQAFFSNSTLVFLPKESHANLEKILNEYQVTNMASTPTFLNTALIDFVKPNTHLLSYSLGGEKVKESDFARVKAIFPNAKVISIYASTEAGSLFKTNSQGHFVVDESMKNMVKADEGHHLLLHKSLLGKSNVIDEDWYDTKDLVEFINATEFKIIGRDSDFINVGGYKVNPHVVEKIILQNSNIKNAVVKSRENRITGNIIIAEIILKDKEIESQTRAELIESCKMSLSEWECPRIFKFVETIDTGLTGKVKR